jgi:NADH-quinone oxidoreductase subunit J
MMVLWILLIAFISICAIGVVFSKSPITSAVSLLVGFIGVAVLYLALNAEFVAAVQVLVYAGGIMVLYIMGVMMTDNQALRLARQTHFQTLPVLGLVLVLFVWMGYRLYHSSYEPVRVSPPAAAAPAVPGTSAAPAKVPEESNTKRIAMVMYSDYLYPFEAASVLLLVAVLGGVFLAKKEV